MKKHLAISFLFISSVFISKSQLGFQWAAGLGGLGSDYPVAVTTDSGSNVYTAGMFGGTADFDPGTGTANMSSAGSNDIFISKLSPGGNYTWSKQVGGVGNDLCYWMSSDASGNLFLTGTFSGLVDFDPGVGIYTLSTVASSIANMFVLKLDVNGNFVWAKQVGNGIQSLPEGRAITTDISGNVYTTGQFTGIRDFDPGPGTFTLATAPFANVFVLKLDVNGNFIWADLIGGNLGLCIATDGAGNVYTGGNFGGTPDFDPGATVFNMSTYGAGDGFIVKLNSSGNFVWARQLGGAGNDGVYLLNVDCQGNVLSTGDFQGGFFANPSSTVSTFSTSGSHDIFISKLDPTGSYMWGKQIGGVESDHVLGFAVDKAGDIYLNGSFGGGSSSPTTTDFDPSPAVYTLASVGANDIFYCKLNSVGDFRWAYAMGTVGGETGRGICVSDNFEVYVTGEFVGTVDFNPFAPVSNLSAAGSWDTFILKLSQDNPFLPVITTTAATGGLKICSGNSATLTASGSGTLNWYPSSTSTTAIGTGSVYITPALTTNTTYYVSAATCASTSAKVPATVTVMPLPSVSVSSGNSLVCEGSKAVLTASGASSYLWSNSLSTPAITVTILTNTTYVVTGTDLNSCSASATVGISASKCAGLEQSVIRTQFFTIYPNPASSEFFIESENAVDFIISDEIGRTVRSISVRGEVRSQRITDLPPGIFFITPDQLPRIKPQKLVILRPE